MKNRTKFQVKFLTVLIVIALIFSGFPATQISGTLNQQVKASSAAGIPNDEVQIDFTMDDGVGLAGIQFTVNYDKDQFFIDESDNNYDGFEDAIVPVTGLSLGTPEF